MALMGSLKLAFRCIVLSALFAAIAADGSLACSGRIVSSTNLSVDYNPFDPIDNLGSHRVTIENTSSEDCAFWLGFVPASGAGGFKFEIKGVSGTPLAAPGLDPAVAARLATRLLAPGETYDFSYMLWFPAGQMLAPGKYDLLFELQLTASSSVEPLPGAARVDTAEIRIEFSIQEYLGINIAGAGTKITVDFGELTHGASQRVIIEARSNQNFTLEASSANGGVMAMDAPYQQWQIDYAMSMAGNSVRLPASAGPFGVTTTAGHSLEVEFVIGDVSGKRAGIYSDEITIEIRPAM